MIYSRVSKLKEIKGFTPIEFEKFVGSLFEHMGYTVATTPVTGDHGVDLFLQKDGKRTIVQCKRYDNQVSSSVIREFYGAMVHYQADEGFLVTTGLFTVPGKAWATNKPIYFIDGQELCEWMGIVRPPALNMPPPLPGLIRPPPIPLSLQKIKRKSYKTLILIIIMLFVFAIVIDLLQQL